MIQENVVLIGMPGAGKSTVGVILAKRIGYDFIDTDLVIQARERRRLQQTIDTYGLDYFRHAEEEAVLALNMERCVIATGGSVIYSDKGLTSLSQNGCIIYLDVTLESLKKRIEDMGQRGLVMARDQTFEDLYSERTPLYQQAADLQLKCDGLNAEQVAAQIEKELLARWPELLDL